MTQHSNKEVTPKDINHNAENLASFLANVHFTNNSTKLTNILAKFNQYTFIKTEMITKAN